MQAWIQSAPEENLHLPMPNVFIPTDLSLKDAEEKVSTLIIFWCEMLLILSICANNSLAGEIPSSPEEVNLLKIVVQAWYGVLNS